jgi:DNA modification methylase
MQHIAEPLRPLAVPMADLNPDAANARTHDQRNIDAIARSLARWGQRQPIVVQKDGMIIRAGNGRYEAAKSLGWSHMAALIVDENSADATAYAIADNRTAELAEWDDESLAGLLQSLDAEDMADAGFTDDDLAEILASLEPELEIVEDEPPEPPADPVTKPGDLWTLGRHRVVCGDSTDADTVARVLGDARPFCFTSPPYTDQRTYHGADVSIEKLTRFIGAAAWAVEAFCVNLGLARKNGKLVTYWDDYTEAARAAGLKLVSWNVWDRGRPGSIGQQTACFPIEHEWVIVYATDLPDLVPTIANKCAGGRQGKTSRQSDGTLRTRETPPIRNARELGTVWRGEPVASNADHPAQFPVELPAEYIKAFGRDVLDPFLGSGTTLIAAEQLGRTCYGIEISPAYCDVIVRRWQNLTGETATRVDAENNPQPGLPDLGVPDG